MIEDACRALVRGLGTTRALIFVVILTLLEITFGTLSRLDPYPFQFLGVLCNVIGIWFMVIIAIGQQVQHRQRERHHDHVLNAMAEHHRATRRHSRDAHDEQHAITRRHLEELLNEQSEQIATLLKGSTTNIQAAEPAA